MWEGPAEGDIEPANEELLGRGDVVGEVSLSLKLLVRLRCGSYFFTTEVRTPDSHHCQSWREL